MFSLGFFGVVHTTWFVWCTTWIVPGNPFAPLGLNSNNDIRSARDYLAIDPSHTVDLQRSPKAIHTFALLGLQFLVRTLVVTWPCGCQAVCDTMVMRH